VTIQATDTSRLLSPQDAAAIQRLLDVDPVASIFVAARVASAGLAAMCRMGELWGYEQDGELVSLCHVGANLVPVQATPAAVRSFAWRAARSGRRCASIVGPAEVVLPLWDLLRPAWGPAREVRPDQPLLVTDRPGPVAPDPAVRPVRSDEIEVLMPAAVAMFTEEVGVDPRADGGEALYRARVAELVHTRRSYARIDAGRVVFKADIGAASARVCQVQGVYVPPDLRGHGLSEPGMAAVVAQALQHHAPLVSLYVNDYNARARATYRAVGFEQVGRFATVLF
jgi:predicted GNAT family acetyltransferase